jgi:hypothetical protein
MSMAIHRSFLAVALSLACLLATARTAGAAAPDGVATFKVPVCESGDLAPASPRGVFVPLCEDRGNGRKSATLGTLLPNGKLLKRSLPRFPLGTAKEGHALEIYGLVPAGV